MPRCGHHKHRFSVTDLGERWKCQNQRVIFNSFSVLTDRFAKIQPFPISANSTAVLPQGSRANASATTSFPKIIVLFTEDLKGRFWCYTTAFRHKGFSYQLTTVPLLKEVGAGVTAHSSWIYCSSQVHPPTSAIATKERNSFASSTGGNPNKDLRVRSHNSGPSATIQWGFNIRDLVRDEAIQKKWRGEKTMLK